MSQKIPSAASTKVGNEVDRENDDSRSLSQNFNTKAPALGLMMTASSLSDDRILGSNGQDPEGTSHETDTIHSGTIGGIFLEQILFFLAGLGSSIGYIATLSSLVYFKVLFGADSFVYLNCAVFLPLLPISLAQLIWDSKYDILWQSKVTFLVRGVLGYGFVISGTVGMVFFAHRGGRDDHDSPIASGGLEWVIFWALLQGIGGAVLFGELNQLASFVGSLHQNQISECSNNNNGDAIIDTTTTTDTTTTMTPDENEILQKKFKATVSAGVQASALVVLLASISSGFGSMNEAYFSNFLVRVLQVEVLCFAAFLWLLIARSRIQVAMMRRDTSMRELTVFSPEMADFQLLLSPCEDDTDNDVDHAARLRLPLLLSPSSPDGMNDQDTSESTMLSLRVLLYHSRMSCIGMALTLVPSFLVGSWFTRVKTDWMELAQILFYVRIGSDFTGRFATILIPPPSIRCVIMTAGFRCIAVIVFFVNAGAKIPLRHQWDRDALSISLVALIAFCSGYLVTSCFQLAPHQIPGTPIIRAANVARQSSLLTVAFSMSAIAGLVTSFVLVSIGV